MKKKTLFAALAIVLVLALTLGGTLAYLFDSSDKVVNTFDTNSNSITIVETTGDEYSVIPGTSETKDPTVYAYTTLESYVFLQVTDNTYGLVEYEINDEIWTALEGYEGVYYTIISEDSQLNILVDDTVSYSASLTNEDMADAEDVTLSFQAYIMQCEGFETAAIAWAGLTDAPVTVESYTELATAISLGIHDITLADNVYLEDDLDLSAYSYGSSTDNVLYLDLNGNYLSLGDCTLTTSNCSVWVVGSGTIAEGSIVCTGNYGLRVGDPSDADADVEVTLRDLYLDGGVNVYNASVKVEFCTIIGHAWYALFAGDNSYIYASNCTILKENNYYTYYGKTTSSAYPMGGYPMAAGSDYSDSSEAGQIVLASCTLTVNTTNVPHMALSGWENITIMSGTYNLDPTDYLYEGSNVSYEEGIWTVEENMG